MPNFPPIGLFGGTFDPIHNGHLQLALAVSSQLQLKQIRFIPNAQPLLREPPVASMEQRWQMLTLALADYPDFVLDDCEIKRGGPSYSIDTLQQLRTAMPDTPLCLMLSLDQFLQFEHWREWQRIAELAHLLITSRPGYQLTVSATLHDMVAERLTQDKQVLQQTKAGAVFFLPITTLPISGTEIRARIRRGEPIADLVPEKVAQYILQQGLYG